MKIMSFFSGVALAACTAASLAGADTYVLGNKLIAPATQATPAKGETYSDPGYGTLVTRITDSKADYGGWSTITGYSTWNPLSSDGKFLVFLSVASLDGANGYVLYNARTLKYAGQLPLSWFNGQDPEPRWDRSGLFPSRLYYRRDKQLRFYDVASKRDGLAHDFAPDLPYGTSYYIYNGEEGNPSADSRYWAFMVRNGDTPYDWAAVIVYDRVEDKVVATKELTGRGADNVSVSPSGQYVYIAYDWTGKNDEYDGPHAYSRDFSRSVKVSNAVPHLNFGYSAQGEEVAIFMDSDYVAFTRLRDGKRFNIYYQGDLGWDGSNLLHAMVGPAKPGWAFISTYSENNKQWDYNQLFAIELDENKVQGSNNPPRIWRVASTANMVGPKYYYQQPNAQMDFDGTHIWWGANWRDINGRSEVYQATLPGTWWQDLSGGGGPDVTPPLPPMSAAATAITTSQVQLSWAASTDNVAVVGYKIYRDGAEVASVPASPYTDTSTSPGDTRTYMIAAYDAAGNVSAPTPPMAIDMTAAGSKRSSDRTAPPGRSDPPPAGPAR